MLFYLGTHKPHRRAAVRQPPLTGLVPDASEVRHWHDTVGGLQWAAAQDWMCEPFILAKTRLSVREHQRKTVHNYLLLRQLAPDMPFVPVLQGWTFDDYCRHVEDYAAAGVDLALEPRVGLGSVCRRCHSTGGAPERAAPRTPVRNLTSEKGAPMLLLLSLLWPDPAATVGRALPAVVVVEAEVRGRPRVSAGTVLDPSGLIVTCRHCLGQSRWPLVRLHDGSTLLGQVVAVSEEHDLALLRVSPPRPLPALRLCPADPRPGQPVTAIGHPLGYRWTVTRGVLSAVARDVEMAGRTLRLLQTDAPVHPGSSGGPLLDTAGHVAGVVVALHEGACGVGFAVPAAVVRDLVRREGR